MTAIDTSIIDTRNAQGRTLAWMVREHEAMRNADGSCDCGCGTPPTTIEQAKPDCPFHDEHEAGCPICEGEREHAPCVDFTRAKVLDVQLPDGRWVTADHPHAAHGQRYS